MPGSHVTCRLVALLVITASLAGCTAGREPAERIHTIEVTHLEPGDRKALAWGNITHDELALNATTFQTARERSPDRLTLHVSASTYDSNLQTLRSAWGDKYGRNGSTPPVEFVLRYQGDDYRVVFAMIH